MGLPIFEPFVIILVSLQDIVKVKVYVQYIILN